MPLVVPAVFTPVASTPSHSSLNVTTLDVRLFLSMDPWGPLFFSGHLIGRTADSVNTWVFSIHPDQKLRTACAGVSGPDSVTPISYPAGITPHWIRSTVSFSAGNGTWNYYTSEDGSSWSQLGPANQTAAATAMGSTVSPLTLPGSTLGFNGRVYYAELRDGIGGTIVANPDFAAQTPGTTSFNDSTGKTWTVTSSGEINTGIRAQQIGVLA
jgi:hypothetical protein